MMKENDQIIEYSEPIFLEGLEYLYKTGDKFSLIKTIALCHQLKEPFPAWVNEKIGNAMHTLYTKTISTTAGKTTSDLFSDNKKAAIKELSLALNGAGVIERHTKLLRDITIAETVALLCEPIQQPKRNYKGVNLALSTIYDAVSMPEEDCTHKQKEIKLKIGTLKEDAIAKIWKEHKNFWLIYDSRFNE